MASTSSAMRNVNENRELGDRREFTRPERLRTKNAIEIGARGARTDQFPYLESAEKIGTPAKIAQVDGPRKSHDPGRCIKG
jgi:hypothetical protein